MCMCQQKHASRMGGIAMAWAAAGNVRSSSSADLAPAHPQEDLGPAACWHLAAGSQAPLQNVGSNESNCVRKSKHADTLEIAASPLGTSENFRPVVGSK